MLFLSRLPNWSYSTTNLDLRLSFWTRPAAQFAKWKWDLADEYLKVGFFQNCMHWLALAVPTMRNWLHVPPESLSLSYISPLSNLNLEEGRKQTGIFQQHFSQPNKQFHWWDSKGTCVPTSSSQLSIFFFFFLWKKGLLSSFYFQFLQYFTCHYKSHLHLPPIRTGVPGCQCSNPVGDHHHLHSASI